MRNYEKLEILRQFPNLQDLNEEEFKKIKSFFIYKEVKKNEYIYQYGDEMNTVYFICTRKMKINSTNIHGKELLLKLYKGKDVFPHIGHYFYGAKYVSHALVVEYVNFFSTPTNKIYDIFSSSTSMTFFFSMILGTQR